MSPNHNRNREHNQLLRGITMAFHEILDRLSETQPTWSRRVRVLAARLYLGIDRIDQHERGLLVTMDGRPLLTRWELREVAAILPEINTPRPTAWQAALQRVAGWVLPRPCHEGV